MQRDFVGYGGKPPQVTWPGGARVAVSLVVNYEEGSEYALGSGDAKQEPYKEYPKALPDGVRDFGNESAYEYGSRVGIWRLLGILSEHRVPATFYACAQALERNAPAARAIAEAGHEVCSHGYRWEEPYLMSEREERDMIARTVRSLRQTTGQRPYGWYSRYSPSPNTLRLLAEEGGFVYSSDSYADDLPYYVPVNGKPFLILPYTLETNDMKFWANASFGVANDFFQYMRDSLDQLCGEAERTPGMMSVGLHLRISGRPGRAVALERFLAYATGLKGVWFARRLDIAKEWLRQQPPRG